MSRPSSLINARAHQRFSDTATKPFLRHIQSYQLDRLFTFDPFQRIARMKPGVTCCDSTNLSNQESR